MRKTATITITDEGRDKGKVFVLTEMAAKPAEKWAGRALLLAAQSGADIGNARGMAGIAVVGIHTIMGTVKFADIEPLLDEMFTCVQIRPDPSRPEIVRALIDRGSEGDDIEEVATRMRLRSEVLTLHLGFSLADALSELKQKASADSQTT